MERLHYANGTLLTGSDIARALLEYAAALARQESSATVDIPFREDDGSIGRANLLIGPASQILSETVQGKYDEVVDVALVTLLHEETQRVNGVEVRVADQGDLGDEPDQSLEFPESPRW